MDASVPDYEAMLDAAPGPMRIGVAREYLGEGLHPETRRAVEAALDVYRKLGAEVHEISLPHAKYTIACYYLICTAQASSCISCIQPSITAPSFAILSSDCAVLLTSMWLRSSARGSAAMSTPSRVIRPASTS